MDQESSDPIRLRFAAMPGGEPIAVPVSLTGSGVERRRAEEGRLRDSLPEGYWIARAEGYVPHLFEWTAPAEGTAAEPREVRLWPARRLVLRFSRANGEAVEGVAVSVVTSDAEPGSRAWTDRLVGQRAASAHPLVRSGGARGRQPSDGVGKDETRGDRTGAKELLADASLFGAEPERGARLAGVPLVAAAGTSDAQGRVALELPAGVAWRWVLWSDHAADVRPRLEREVAWTERLVPGHPHAVSGSIELAPDAAPLELDVRILSGSAVTGFVDRASACSGAPVALELKRIGTVTREGVVVDQSRSTWASAGLEGDGAFAFDEVPPGPMSLTATWECGERRLVLAWARFEVGAAEVTDLGNLAERVLPGRLAVRVGYTPRAQELVDEHGYEDPFVEDPGPPLWLSVRAPADRLAPHALWETLPVDPGEPWLLEGLPVGEVVLGLLESPYFAPREGRLYGYPQDERAVATAAPGTPVPILAFAVEER